MRYHAVLVVAVLLAGCTPKSSTTTTEARLRNDPPQACTGDQLKACPVPDVTVCPDGKEPVLDYSSDCCVHFSCQPVCAAAQPCQKPPAPVCPAGTKLWIGTALEDCCPAYRCEPDNSCDATKAVCTLAMPYCGNGVQPVIVGQTPDCCPIYQCPCDATGSAGACTDVGCDPTLPSDPTYCGCTFPNCAPGEELQCEGQDRCKGPCKCVPAHGYCASDSECPADARCDLSNCLLPPNDPVQPALCDPAKCGPALGMPNKLCDDGKTVAGPTGRCLLANGACSWEVASCPPAPAVCDKAKCGPELGMASVLCPDGKNYKGPTGRCLASPDGRCVWEIAQCPPAQCDATQCGPQPLMPNKLCPDGKTIAGPTGRCLADAAGKCGWEIVECPTVPVDNCYGVCVPNVKDGCKSDSECPSGQMCEIACSGWACAANSTDPNGAKCVCPASDPTCKCDATGNCGGQSCTGKCVPATPHCDPNVAPSCPKVQLACPNNAQPIVVGTDPTTCCPIQQCPSCAKNDQPIACPVLKPDPTCACTVSDGTDANTCCPIYRCGKLDPNGKCL